MKIYHISSPLAQMQIRVSGVIKATPQLVWNYDENGQPVQIEQNRAYFCKTRNEAIYMKNSFEFFLGGIWEIGEFEVGEIPPHRWRNTGRPGVYFAQDVEPFLKRRGINVSTLPVLEYDSANTPEKIV